MARCTAPVNGHRTASGAAACPACSSRSRGYGYSPYTTPYYSSGSSSSSLGGRSSVSGSGGSVRPRWSRAGSSVVYTPAEVRTLTPVRENFERRANLPDLRDVFLCHAWDDRNGVARELHDLLESRGGSVWFSEKDVRLGSTLFREIDKGLAKSRVGIVLVTPALLQRVAAEGIADKELSALLARDLLVPIVHNTTEWVSYWRVAKQPVLLGFNAADQGRDLEDLSDTEIVDSAMKTLKAIYGQRIPEPLGHLITRWAQDPFAMGSYSFNAVGSTPEMREVLAQPLQGKLYFAGEATHSSHFGTAHGAYLSGLKAAKEILSSR